MKSAIVTLEEGLRFGEEWIKDPNCSDEQRKVKKVQIAEHKKAIKILKAKEKKKKLKKKRKNFIRRTILVTHWDKNIDPEILTIKGETEKDLIYEYSEESEKVMYALGSGDEFLNKIAEGEIPREELIKEIMFETLDDFLKHLNSVSEYHFRDK